MCSWRYPLLKGDGEPPVHSISGRTEVDTFLCPSKAPRNQRKRPGTDFGPISESGRCWRMSRRSYPVPARHSKRSSRSSLSTFRIGRLGSIQTFGARKTGIPSAAPLLNMWRAQFLGDLRCPLFFNASLQLRDEKFRLKRLHKSGSAIEGGGTLLFRKSG